MTSYDLIVCGAGPAGACAAYSAAKAGMRTLLLERRTLPRYKTCGGGVPITVARDLPQLVPEAFVESTVTHLRHTWNFGDSMLGSLNVPDEPPVDLWMVQRSIFDNALTNRAAAAGSEVRDNCAIASLEPDGTTAVRVTTHDGDVLTSSFIVGADGANGIVARASGLRKNRVHAVALEAEIPHDWLTGSEILQPHVAHLEYAVPKGYAWIFPKAEHLSIGAGIFGKRTADGRGDAKKDELVRWIRGYMEHADLGVPAADQIFHGHTLPIWNGSEPIHAWDGRVLLAGDAAGMVNPLFGDGISYACKTGKRSAECIVGGQAARWTETVAAEFGPNMDAALKIAKFFYQFPGTCYKWGVKHPRGTHTAGRLISGTLGFDAVLNKLPWNKEGQTAQQGAW